MSEKAAENFRRTQEESSSPEELRRRIAELRETWDLPPEELTGIAPIEAEG